MEIIYYYIIKFSNKHKTYIPYVYVIIFMTGLLFSKYINCNLPFGINTVICLGFFYYFGYIIKKPDLIKEKPYFINYISLGILFIIGFCGGYFNKTVSCIDFEYGNYVLFLLSGTCLSLLEIIISYYIKENKILEYIGKNTMGILIFHKLIIIVFQTKLGSISNLLKSSNIVIEVLLSIVVSTLSIIISLIATEIMRKGIPILIGEKKKINCNLKEGEQTN